jgi:ornithine--oxo-acid transaminase
MKPADYVAREDKYLAKNYKSFPFILNRAEGVWLWDTEGKKYLDFVAAYSAVSFGHLNKRIREALLTQL